MYKGKAERKLYDVREVTENEEQTERDPHHGGQREPFNREENIIEKESSKEKKSRNETESQREKVDEERRQPKAVKYEGFSMFLSFNFIIWLAGSCSGYYLGSIGQLGLLMGEEMSWTTGERELFVGSMFVFSIFGALFTPSLANWIGRKAVLALNFYFFILSSILTSISTTFYLSLLGRFFAGSAIGSSQVMTSLYPLELMSHSPLRKSWRGLFVTGNEVLLNLGLLFGALISYYSTLPSGKDLFRQLIQIIIYPLMKTILGYTIQEDQDIEETWRGIPLVGFVFSVIGFLLTLCFLPESPYYLLLKRYYLVRRKAHRYTTRKKECLRYERLMEKSSDNLNETENDLNRKRRVSSILIQEGMMKENKILTHDKNYNSNFLSEAYYSSLTPGIIYEDEKNNEQRLVKHEDTNSFTSLLHSNQESGLYETQERLLDIRDSYLPVTNEFTHDTESDKYVERTYNLLSSLYSTDINHIIDDINQKIYWEQYKRDLETEGVNSDANIKNYQAYNKKKSTQQQYCSYTFKLSEESIKLLLIIFMLASMHQLTGLSVIDNYTPDLLKQIGITATEREFQVLTVLNLSKFFFALINALTVDKFGRRPMLLLSFTICFFALTGTTILQFILSRAQTEEGANENDNQGFEGYNVHQNLHSTGGKTYHLQSLYTFCLCLWNASFSLGIGPLTWLSITELSPATTFRSNVISLAICWNRILCALINLTALTMFVRFGSYYLLIYNAFSAFGGLFFLFYFPESKGQSIRDIKNQLRKSK